jgi:hypothetical protein
MVNYKDAGSYAPIAELALLFEAMLLESRLAPTPAKVEP